MLSCRDFKRTLLIKLQNEYSGFTLIIKFWKYHRIHAGPWKYCLALNQSMVQKMLAAAGLDDVTVIHLDAVGELLQSFGSDRFHGGDECRQLVLGARRRALRTDARCIDTILTLRLVATVARRKPTGGRPAAWCRTRTCSSWGASGWGRWWGRPSSRASWWPGALLTQCCRRPTSGCPAPPVEQTV